jgi:hypothetical protein
MHVNLIATGCIEDMLGPGRKINRGQVTLIVTAISEIRTGSDIEEAGAVGCGRDA